MTNTTLPDQHHLREAALELAGQGLTEHDVDQVLRLPPGMAAGLLADSRATGQSGHPGAKTAA